MSLSDSELEVEEDGHRDGDDDREPRGEADAAVVKKMARTTRPGARARRLLPVCLRIHVSLRLTTQTADLYLPFTRASLARRANRAPSWPSGQVGPVGQQRPRDASACQPAVAGGNPAAARCVARSQFLDGAARIARRQAAHRQPARLHRVAFGIPLLPFGVGAERRLIAAL